MSDGSNGHRGPYWPHGRHEHSDYGTGDRRPPSGSWEPGPNARRPRFDNVSPGSDTHMYDAGYFDHASSHGQVNGSPNGHNGAVQPVAGQQRRGPDGVVSPDVRPPRSLSTVLAGLPDEFNRHMGGRWPWEGENGETLPSRMSWSTVSPGSSMAGSTPDLRGLNRPGTTESAQDPQRGHSRNSSGGSLWMAGHREHSSEAYRSRQGSLTEQGTSGVAHHGSAAAQRGRGRPGPRDDPCEGMPPPGWSGSGSQGERR